MPENIASRDALRGLARSRSRSYETQTVHTSHIEEAISDGWTIDKKNRKSVRLRRPKSLATLLEDRVWTLLYRTGFSFLSGSGGESFLLDPKNQSGPCRNLDIIGIDDELVLAIDCEANDNYGRVSHLAKKLASYTLIRERFANLVNKEYPIATKRQVVFAMFLANVALSENDRACARENQVLLFDEHDLDYYETLVGHLGPAAKYQLFADMLPGKTVAGLAIRIPAVRTKMGSTNCYTFCITPSYLLKISYVSHRAKGRASDVHTYQRMLNKGRLRRIREYISQDGIFPTNIVVNFEAKRLRFERIQQEDQENGVLGWLDIRPTYRSAWIIDGQHRLFAYSGHERANTSRLSVLAFEGLPPSKQAGLFIDINAKQKSVKQSLLQELYAELHWDAEEPEVRVRAIVSKAIQMLDADPECALYHRIQTADAAKSETRCISLTSLYGAVEKREFHIAKERKGQVLEYGPLWGGDNDETLRRTFFVLKNWFDVIRSGAPEWWDRGAGDGGGLAMNDGVTACVNVLRSVFVHLAEQGHKLVHLDSEDLFAVIRKYGEELGAYFGSFTEQDRRAFRDLRGVQGQTRRTRMCQQGLHARWPEFSPPGLEEFLREQKAQTNTMAKEIVDRIETSLQRVVFEELKREYGPDDSQWWILGVPKPVRLKVTQRREDDDGARGGKEYYFDLIDYRTIATQPQNWPIFESLFGFEKGSKEKRTAWMVFVNEKRRIVSHASSAVTISIEDLGRLQEYDRWLASRLAGEEIVGSEEANEGDD